MVLSETENLGYCSTPKQDVKPQVTASEMVISGQEDQSLNKDLQLSPLGGQNSIMSLTLNEIQLKSGKNFGSMNMDEFLANLWTNVDDNSNNQLVPTANLPNQTNEPAKAADNEPPTLARQGSFSIPAPLCKKTVDQVWDEIQKDQPQQQTHDNNNGSNSNIGVNVNPVKQQTFGEITLEDFLVKAGVVQEAPPPSSGHNHGANNNRILTSYQNAIPCLETSFGLGHLMSLGLPSPHDVGTSGFSPYHHHMFPNKGYGETTGHVEVKSDRGQEEMNDMNAHHSKNKRIIDGPLEVVVERRQRRMIKNRESAARSRARKQAYTVELELELDQLKQENTKLKLIVEEIERKRKEEVLKRKVPTGLKKKVDKLRSLRRTASWKW